MIGDHVLVPPNKPSKGPKQYVYPWKQRKASQVIQRVSALIYGYPGAGKTFLARSLLEDENLWPALVLVCDAGEVTLKDVMTDDRMQVVNADLATLTVVMNWLVMPENKGAFKSVFIDNISELHQKSLRAQALKGSSTGTRTKDEYTQQDYGVARNQILAVTSAFATELPWVSVFVTCLAATVFDESTGSKTIEPNLSGKLSTEVPGYFDVVGYLRKVAPSNVEKRKAEKAGKVAKTRRELVVDSTSDIPIARNRGGMLGEVLKNPTLPHIFRKVTGLDTSEFDIEAEYTVVEEEPTTGETETATES